MKTYLTILVIIFSLLSLNAQVSPYKYTPKKYTPVKKSTKTSGMINTMSKSNNTYIKKSSYKSPTKMANYNSAVASKSISTNGKSIGTIKLVAVGSNYKPSLKINKRPFPNNTKGCVNTNLSLKANQLSIGFITENNPPSWLVPGAVFKASSLLSSNPTPVNYPRKPVKLTALSVNSGSSTMVNNSERRSNLSQGVSKIFHSVKGENVSALITFDYKEVHTVQELELYLNGSYSANFGVTNFSASLSSNYNSKNEYNFYLIKVRQYLFSIGTDDYDFSKNDFFDSTSVNKKDLVYISNIDYGRIVSVLVESKLDLKEFKGSLEVKLNTLLSKSELKAGIKTLKRNENFQIKALFYGGDASGAVNSLLNTIENKKADISSYLKSMPSDPSLGRPISYTLRSLNGGYDVAINTSLNQNVKTCIPIETKKLVVKLDAFYCVQSQDSDNKDDYAFNQWIDFKINNKPIKAVKTYRTTKFFKDFNGNSSQEKRYPNRLMSGDIKHQFWVAEGSHARLGHYVVFEFSDEDINNILKGNYSFRIINRVKEYSGGSGKDSYLAKGEEVDLDLKNVYLDLISIDDLEIKKYKSYQKGGSQLKMRKYAKDKKDIYGYINFSKDDRKARAMMRFELKD